LYSAAGLELEQHRTVDQLDIDAAGMHRLDAGGDLDQLVALRLVDSRRDVRP
jgi:hypothetical protein